MNAREQLIGVWQLVSCETQHANGRVSYPFGQQPRGRLIYHANGEMAALILDSARAKFAEGSTARATSDEIRSALAGALAYFGAYELAEADGVVLHHVQASLFPNWNGVTHTRFFRIEGKRLFIQNPPVGEGAEPATTHLVWERI